MARHARLQSRPNAGVLLKALVACLTIALTLGTQLIAIGSAEAVPPAAEPGVPWIQSELPDYAPGATVHLDGGNWQAGETVRVYVNDDQGRTWERTSDVVADADGLIVDDFNLPDWFVAAYQVTATGGQSGVATATFTDGNIKLTVTPTGAGTVAFTAYASSGCAGSVKSTGGVTTTGTLGAGNTESVRYDAQDGTGAFVSWAAETGLSYSTIDGTGGRSICVSGNFRFLKSLRTCPAIRCVLKSAVAEERPRVRPATAGSTEHSHWRRPGACQPGPERPEAGSGRAAAGRSWSSGEG